MASTQPSTDASRSGILAHATAEALTPGADTGSQYECPFCVMMRKGGCEEVFKAFMECGEKADKGQSEMADCLPQFEQLHLCMEKNKVVFDGLLQEMKEEEDRNKAAAAAADDAATAAAASSSAAGQQHEVDTSLRAATSVHAQEQQHQRQQASAENQSVAVEQQKSSSQVQHVQHDREKSAAVNVATARHQIAGHGDLLIHCSESHFSSLFCQGLTPS